jgi:hypothetical protein
MSNDTSYKKKTKDTDKNCDNCGFKNAKNSNCGALTSGIVESPINECLRYNFKYWKPTDKDSSSLIRTVESVDKLEDEVDCPICAGTGKVDEYTSRMLMTSPKNLILKKTAPDISFNISLPHKIGNTVYTGHPDNWTEYKDGKCVQCGLPEPTAKKQERSLNLKKEKDMDTDKEE